MRQRRKGNTKMHEACANDAKALQNTLKIQNSSMKDTSNCINHRKTAPAFILYQLQLFNFAPKPITYF